MNDPIIMSICIELELVSNKRQKKMWIWEGSGEVGLDLGGVWGEAGVNTTKLHWMHLWNAQRINKNIFLRNKTSKNLKSLETGTFNELRMSRKVVLGKHDLGDPRSEGLVWLI